MLKKKKQKRKSKSISLYIVKDITKDYLDKEKTIPYIACVTSTEEEANEYIQRKLMLDNSSHFNMWCELRKVNPNEEAWCIYKKALEIENPYVYFKFEVGYDMISSILRIFYGCAPIGCSFDTIMETANALIQLPEDEIRRIENTVLEKLKGQNQ